MVIMDRVISKDGADTWRRIHRVHRQQIFSSFLCLYTANGLGVIIASRLCIPSFVYRILVKAINSKDELKRWSLEVKVAVK